MAGCASTPQTDRVLQNPGSLRPSVELQHIQFYPQEAYQCGPAALAMVLSEHRREIRPEELTDKVFIPERQGSLQLELIAATRRYGLIPYVIEPELSAMLNEIQQERPVLVLQNLGLSWFPKWHYAVAVGYDLPGAEMLLRSGLEHRHRVGLRTFERTWQRGKHWAMVVLKPGEMPAQAEEWRYVQAIVGFEQLKRWDILQTAYRHGLERWPNSLLLQMGLGNLYFATEDKQAAKSVYQRVAQQYPDYAPAHNNLAQVLADLGELSQALQHAQRALQIGGAHAAIYQATYDALRARTGSRHDAAAPEPSTN